MRVDVVEHFADRTRTFSGPEREVCADLLAAYPWLRVKLGPHAAANNLVTELNHAQAFSAGFHDGLDDIEISMNKSESRYDWLKAAEFVAGKPADPTEYRRARVRNPEDDLAAALDACGLGPNDAAAVRGVATVDTAAEHPGEPPATADKDAAVLPGVPGSGPAAEQVGRAFKAGRVEPIKLGGRHSKGTLLAVDPETHHRWILKPGSGKQNPSRGDSESGASQSKREAAYYACAESLGLQDHIAETRLLLIDGDEYAAVAMVSEDYEDLKKLTAADPTGAKRLLSTYLVDGTTHKWAYMDYILGNVDSHAGNVMVRTSDAGLYLIDHGSAFAGDAFAPATDPDVFTPAYLRLLTADPGKWSQLTPGQRYREMPRLQEGVAGQVAGWIKDVKGDELVGAFSTFGIEWGPVIQRVDRVAHAVLTGTPGDLAVNAAWTLP